MDLADTNGMVRVTDGRVAGEVLRPAFVLWLLVVGLWGGYWHLTAWSEDDGAAPHLLLGVLYLVVSVADAAIVAAFAWRDRTACRVFARPRRGMVELCLLVGIVGSLALAMWENTMPGGDEGPFAWEQEAGWPASLVLLVGAAVPALFEELMFRGVILQRLRVVLAGPLAVAVQAMMFSVMHVDAVYLLPHFAFGCLAGFLRIAARALWPCITMHFLWNGTLVLEQYGWW